MESPPISMRRPGSGPLHRPERLAALARAGLLDGRSDELLDAAMRQCARLLEAPMAMVSLVDAHRQVFRGACGLPAPLATSRETPLSQSLCAHVVTLGDELLIDDARADAIFSMHPAYTELGIVAYAGVPLVVAGEPIGAVCAADVSPRRWGPRDVDALRDFAAMVAVQLDRDRMRGDLQRALDVMTAADRRRSEFLATLAHELRNPIAPIATSARVLSAIVGDSPIARRSVETIERQVRVMRRLVDDLLDVNRIERDVLRLEPRRVPLDEIVDAALESVQPLVDGRRLELEVRRPDATVWLDADPARLSQVLTNLLGNAAKFTPEGGRVSLEAGPADDAIEFRVRDTGIGIAPEARDRIFELFAQSEPMPGEAQGGLGIGLALSRRLVAMHGGTLVVDSEGPGRGSTFTLRIPARRRGPGH
ncbi:MAG TPA: GAF domain-containing sensor histidine kinase [Burkholderiaceae bacterium]|nr:GAF domain-containing sensor histidine kinase [Burkholderiaceae bacterium]